MTGKRIMFARTAGIGNALASVPALRAIKTAWPDAEITMVVDPASATVLENCPYITEILVYDKRGDDAGMGGYLRFLGKLRRRKFTHAILSKRFLRMSLLARLAGAPVRVGFWGYGHAITVPVKWNAERSVVKTNLDLVAALGIQPRGYESGVWPSPENVVAAEKFLADHGLSGHPFIVAIHPGGISQKDCLWPAENYVELASSLAENYGAAPVFIGSKPDADVLAVVRAVSDDNFPVCDGLDIRATAHLISRCRMFVGSDSAPSHLANAVGTPSVVYYGPKEDFAENLSRWFPLTGNVVAATPVAGGTHPTVAQMLEKVAELTAMMDSSRGGSK